MQNLSARQNYLQAEVHTATPQKVRLMLIEAALKNIYRTKKAWDEERFESGFESLALAQDIVAELLSSLDKESNPELAAQIASIYVFIFRCLAEGGMTHDQKKLDDAIKVLTSERETWRQVCEKFGSTQGTESSARLDISADSSAAASVIPKPSVPKQAGKPTGITTAAFARPAGFGAGGAKPVEVPTNKSNGGVSWDV